MCYPLNNRYPKICSKKMMKPSSCKTGKTNWQEICGFYTHSECMLLLKTQLLFFLSPFIHSFIFFCCLFGSESHGHRCPDLPLFAMFPSHLSDVISPSCPGSSLEPPSGGTCQKYLTWSDARTSIFLLLMWRSGGSTLSPSQSLRLSSDTVWMEFISGAYICNLILLVSSHRHRWG